MENIDYTKEIDLGLAKILVLANLINRKTELCCFVEDVAHCRRLNIKIHKDIKSYNNPAAKFETYYDEGKYEKDGKERLEEINRCVEFLEQCLKDRKIDYAATHKVMESVVKEYLI